MVVADIVNELKGSSIDVSDVEETPKGWIIKGTCSSDRDGSMWAEKFEIMLDNKGKVKSTDFNLRWRKNETDESWTIHTDLPSKTNSHKKELDIEVEAENLEERVSKNKPPVIESSKNISNEKENRENELRMEGLDQSIKKIEILKSTKRQLDLEREKLGKKLEHKAASLEMEIKGMETEIRRMKLLLDEDDVEDKNTEVELELNR